MYRSADVSVRSARAAWIAATLRGTTVSGGVGSIQEFGNRDIAVLFVKEFCDRDVSIIRALEELSNRDVTIVFIKELCHSNIVRASGKILC